MGLLAAVADSCLRLSKGAGEAIYPRTADTLELAKTSRELTGR